MKQFLAICKYLILTIKHKYFVFKVGRKIKVPICTLLLHDLSKFYISELPHYGKQFFGTKNDSSGFIRCWLNHQNRNKHHWEFWIPRTGHNRCTPLYKDNEPIRMPDKYVKEMVADWLGASRAYEGKFPKSLKDWEWFNANFDKIIVHKETRKDIEFILSKYFNDGIQ